MGGSGNYWIEALRILNKFFFVLNYLTFLQKRKLHLPLIASGVVLCQCNASRAVRRDCFGGMQMKIAGKQCHDP